MRVYRTAEQTGRTRCPTGLWEREIGNSAGESEREIESEREVVRAFARLNTHPYIRGLGTLYEIVFARCKHQLRGGLRPPSPPTLSALLSTGRRALLKSTVNTVQDLCGTRVCRARELPPSECVFGYQQPPQSFSHSLHSHSHYSPVFVCSQHLCWSTGSCVYSYFYYS